MTTKNEEMESVAEEIESTMDATVVAPHDEAQLESPEKNADSLEVQLEIAQAKASENWDQFLRTKAEMDNLRRRHQKDIENAHKFGVENLVNELLPIIDSMDLGLATKDASVESLREGMEITLSMLKKMLEKLGIAEINPLNEKFNSDEHQAMSMQVSAEVEPNTVIAVMQKGFLLKNRLLRPAMVIVSKSPEEPVEKSE